MFKGELFPFQREAVEFMVDKRNVLLAFQMGLGKTVCTIAAVERLIEEGHAAGGLCVMPSSLKFQWAEQIDRFTGGMANVQVIDGTPRQRERQYARVMRGEVEYTILNYEQVVNDWEYVRRLPRDFIVADECQAIKHNSAKRTRKLKQLKAKYRWGLTGQPVENRAEEVFSIMEWIDPSVLGPADVFDRTFIRRDYFGQVQRYVNLDVLHKALSRCMVRATWKMPDIAAQMPKVVEESVIVPFDKAGASLYRRISADLLGLLEDLSPTSFDLERHYAGVEHIDGHTGAVMSRLMCLRMLCDHPELLRISAAHYVDPNKVSGSAVGSVYASDLSAAGLLDKLTASPKTAATVELITEILQASPDNKIVLFSYFKDALRILQDATKDLTGSVLFMGDMNLHQREEAKKTFQTDPACRLFLSSDAGGVGVDLPQANYLISFDLPWSAGAWAQRKARIIRLSSTFDHVTITSMLMHGSTEERYYDVLQMKQSVSDAIIDGAGYNQKGELALNLKTLSDFLRTSEV